MAIPGENLAAQKNHHAHEKIFIGLNILFWLEHDQI